MSKTFIDEVKALERLFPFEIVQGDMIMRTNPHSSVCVNSGGAWLVSQDIKSAHKLRVMAETVNGMAEALIAIDELSKKWLKGHTEEEWCGEQIQKILEGEGK